MDFVIEAHYGKDHLYYVGDMPETLEEAWGMTLQKWALLAETPYHIDDHGARTCGLCMYAENNCKACPVGQIGYEYCLGTPYRDYAAQEKPEAAIQEFWFLLGLYAAGLKE